VHEFLGAITYRASGRPKVVQFWRMVAYARPSRDVMSDIVAVEWLPLPAAVRRLSFPLEKLFLQHAGKRVRKVRKPAKRRTKRSRRKSAVQTRRRPAGRGKAAPSRARAARRRGVLQRMLGRLSR